MEKQIKNFKGFVTRFGKFRKGIKSVPLRVKLNTEKYLELKKNKGETNIKAI